MATRALISLPERIARGEPFEVRTTLGHPNENGLRPDGYGNVVPRNLVTRLDVTLDGRPVFGADLWPAVAANPYVAFWLRADAPGSLVFEWTGDHGFSHRETRALVLA